MLSLEDLKFYPNPNLALFFSATTDTERELVFNCLPNRSTYTIFPQDTSGSEHYELTLVEIACILGLEEHADFLIHPKNKSPSATALCFALKKSESFSQKICYNGNQLHPEFQQKSRNLEKKYFRILELVCINGSLSDIKRVHQFVEKMQVNIKKEWGITDTSKEPPLSLDDLHRWLKIAMSSNDVGVLEYILNDILKRPFNKLPHSSQALVMEHLIRHKSEEVFEYYAKKWKINDFPVPEYGKKECRCHFINDDIDFKIGYYFWDLPIIKTFSINASYDVPNAPRVDAHVLQYELLRRRVIKYISIKTDDDKVNEDHLHDITKLFPIVCSIINNEGYDEAVKSFFKGSPELFTKYLNEWGKLAFDNERYYIEKDFISSSIKYDISDGRSPLSRICADVLQIDQLCSILASHINKLNVNSVVWRELIKQVMDMVKVDKYLGREKEKRFKEISGVRALLCAAPNLLAYALGHPTEFNEWYTAPMLYEYWKLLQTQKEPLSPEQLTVVYTYFTYIFSHPDAIIDFYDPVTREKFLQECFLIPELREQLARELQPSDIHHWYELDNSPRIKELFLTVPRVEEVLRDHQTLSDEGKDYTESAMRGLNKRETDVYNAIVNNYQEKVMQQGEESIHAEILSKLELEYQNQPIKITLQDGICSLPLKKEDFDRLNLNPDEMRTALQAYYEHPLHTAYRFLLTPNNPWMYEEAMWIIHNPQTGDKCADFRAHLSLICCSWLLVKENNPPIMPKAYNYEQRLNYFVTVLSELGRRHNRDDGKDDGLGDRPSCTMGMRRGLVRIGLDYLPKVTEVLNPGLMRKPKMTQEEANDEQLKFISLYYQQQHLSYAQQVEIEALIISDDLDALKKFDIPRYVIRDWLRGVINEGRDIATLPFDQLANWFSQTKNPHLYFHSDIRGFCSKKNWKEQFDSYLQKMTDYHTALSYTHPLRATLLRTIKELEQERNLLFGADLEISRASSIRCYEKLNALTQKACDTRMTEKLSNLLHNFGSFLAIITIFPALVLKFVYKKTLSSTLFKPVNAIKSTEALKEDYNKMFRLESENKPNGGAKR